MATYRPTLLGITFLLAATRVTSAQGVTELLRMAPDETNAVAVIQVARLHQSPLGRQEGWADQHALEFLRGAANIPPWAKLVIRAAHMKPGVAGGEWNIGLAVHSQGIDLESTRPARGASLDAIQGHPVLAARPLNGYYVEVQPATDMQDGIMAVLTPATRQDVARWLSEVDANTPTQVSEFLRESAEGSDADILLALDMRDMVDPETIRTRLLFTDGLVGETETVDRLAELFGGLRGVRFEVRVTDSMQGRVVLDFSRQIGPEGKHLRQILLDVMHDFEAAVEELAEASVSWEGASAVFESPISNSTLRRILSLIGELPLEPPSVPSGAERVGEWDGAATIRYFNAVNRLVDDVKRSHDARRPSYVRSAAFHKSYADRIRRLRTAGVAPNVVTYGQNIADSLHALSESLRGVGIEINQLGRRVTYRAVPDSTVVTATVWPGVTQPITWANTVRFESNLRQVREAQIRAAQNTAPDREEIWAFIKEQREQVTQYLRDEYNLSP